jgi:AcrR family transcriptional regulator
MASLQTLTPRKQPRQSRAHATREAIVTAAAQIISRDGLGGYNTNVVALRAGVSIGSLYQYFPNKNALMVALIERQQSDQLKTLTDVLATIEGQTLQDIVRQLVRAAMAHHIDDPLLATAIDHEEARLPIKPALDHLLTYAGRGLRILIESRRDELGAIDIDKAVTTLPILVRAIVDAWANQTPPQLQTAEDEAVRAVLGYLGV